MLERFSWRVQKLLKFVGPALVILLFAVGMSVCSRAMAYNSFSVEPFAANHVAALNSNVPYVAGFHVNLDDLSLREVVNATEVTVSFPSVNPEYFPSGSWLGGGMFVQGQDHVFYNVDYGFYMMLVVDAEGRMFVDLGLHQTGEGMAQNHNGRSNLVYAYTWQLMEIDTSTPVTLLQSWDNNGYVHYSVSVSGQTRELTTINVVVMPNCQNMIRKFYAGNVIMNTFPLSIYINYFQFGIVSNRPIPDTHWQVDVEEPKMLRPGGWVTVDKAWSLEGDHSYLDSSLMWGGTVYDGVNAKYYTHGLQNPSEIIFFYDGQTLHSGTILWDISNTSNNTDLVCAVQDQAVTRLSRQTLPVIMMSFGVFIFATFLWVRRKRLNVFRH